MDAPAHSYDEDIQYPSTIPFVLIHLTCFAAFWTGVPLRAVALAVALYFLRIFAIGAGYHRYFAHRAYKTSRAFQFVLGFLCQSSAQRGVLWWAAKHRWHHRHSDTELDVHSPVRQSFLYAHMGWIFTSRHGPTPYELIRDFATFPELRWLDRHPYLPAAVLAALTFAIAGWAGLVVGFCWSTVAVWHATFCINSLAHTVGRRRYVTGDASRNNWFLAILTMGEGWHNNHHACQSAVRQGFRWWEWDPTFYILKALSWTGLVWDLNAPPASLVRGEQRLGSRIIEKVAQQLASSFPVDGVVAQMREAVALSPRWAELKARARTGRMRAEAFVAELHLPNVPTLEDVRQHVQARLVQTPSMEDIVARTRQVLLELVFARVIEEGERV